MWKNRTIDADKIIKRTKRLSDFISTKTRHFLQTTKDKTKNLVPKENISFKSFINTCKTEGRGILDHNLSVTQISNNVKKLAEGNVAGQTLLKLSQYKWFRRSIIGVAALTGLTLLERTINGFDPKPSIPKNYERGYDLMNETMTDFGSPVKLNKVASKIITPYYSSIRKGIVTTTNSVINKNLSLALSSKAIGHSRY